MENNVNVFVKEVEARIAALEAERATCETPRGRKQIDRRLREYRKLRRFGRTRAGYDPHAG